jgi:hypothetical protein
VIKPPPYEIRKIKNPAHRCFELVNRAVGFQSERHDNPLAAAHGYFPVANGTTIPFHAATLACAHGWVIDLLDNTVFDTARWEWCALADYPGVEFYRYTQDAILKRCLNNGIMAAFPPEDWPDGFRDVVPIAFLRKRELVG